LQIGCTLLHLIPACSKKINMAQIKNNPLLKGLSGMLGSVIVFREIRGKMTMACRPGKRKALTEHQKMTKSRFMQAVQYAKAQMQDPLAKAEYLTGISDRHHNAYTVALADYLKGPEITAVDFSDYKGHHGNRILIQAIDNFKVTDVTLEIRNPVNGLIEEGHAATGDNRSWYYQITKFNPHVTRSRIIIRARDKANNVTTKQFVLT
jgi:hypothetical protein